MRESACCFTGHRALSREDSAVLQYALRNEIARLTERGVTAYYSGGAMGFDMLAAETVLEMRRTLPVTLHLLLPCRDQAVNWPLHLKRRYDAVLQAADSVAYITEKYDSTCMFRRNDALVAHTAFCICYLQKPKGGTAYTVRKARREGLEIIHLLTVDAEKPDP